MPAIKAISGWAGTIFIVVGCLQDRILENGVAGQ